MALKKQLGFIDVYCIATGAMFSSGLFVLPGLAHAKAGPAVIFSYFFAGLLAMIGMLSEAELVSAMPKAGGTYFYVTRSMGPAAGTVNGLLIWFSLSLKSAFALVGMTAFLQMIAPVNAHLAGLAFLLIFVGMNLVGVREAAKLQVGLVAGLIVILLWYILKGAGAVEVHNFVPFAPAGLYGVLSTAGFVFISYGGLLKVTSVAEEVREPSRTIPRAMTAALVTGVLMYTIVVFITSGVMDGEALSGSVTPISDGAEAFMGRTGVILLSLAAVLAFVSTANAGIMAAARYPFALARDNLLPDLFSRVHARFDTPHVAVLLTGALIAVSLFLKLDILVETASTVLIMTYMFSCMSVIVMRESGVQNYRPGFKGPFYPWMHIAGIIGFGMFILEMGIPAIAASAVLITGGLFVYWFYGRIRTSRESAILHLIQRITDRQLTSRSLEQELREILLERDNVKADRFDHLVADAPILDFNDCMEAGSFFRAAAEKLAPRIGMTGDDLCKILLEREKDSSTVIGEHIAIPHVIVDGEGKFDMLMARCRGGIRFSEEHPSVNTIFILVGTRDERNFHLRALSAIAQIVHDPSFVKHWMTASDENALRDLVLLGKRRR